MKTVSLKRIGLTAAARCLFFLCLCGSAGSAVRPTVPFIENRGQQDSRVAFYTSTFAGTVFVTRDGEIVYSLPATKASNASAWSIVESFVDGAAQPRSSRRAESAVTLIAGGDAKSAPAFRDVRLGEVWRGIDVTLRAHNDNIEKLFTLAPGVSPASIKVSMRGIDSMKIDANGALAVMTGNGAVKFTAPVAFQDLPSGRKAVAVKYVAAGKRYGFEIGAHDERWPVVIDPLIQSTYFGGSGTSFAFEGAHDIAIHPTNGQVYVAGRADSPNFPGTTGGAIPARPAGTTSVGFIARYNPELTTLLQATYIGGAGGQEAINRILLTATEVFVAGTTESSAFPQTAGGAQASDPNAGLTLNSFIARLPLSLTSITQATYLGGTTTHDTVINAMLLHSNGDVYVCGHTTSGSLPNLGGVDSQNNPGLRTGFISRINAALTSYAISTYYTDTGAINSVGTICQALGVDAATGEIYAGGYSEAVNLPSLAGGALTTGTYGAWLARFNSALTVNFQSTWLAQPTSGTNPQVFGVQKHPANGDIYVLTTGSSASPMPAGATIGGGQATCNGTFNCLLVLRLNPALTSVVGGTFYGSPNSGALIPRGTNHMFIDGTTGDVFAVSDGASGLPNMSGGIQPTVPAGAATPGFVVRIRNDLGAIIQASYLGGNGITQPVAVALHPLNGDLYVAGQTQSTNLPGVTGGAQSTHAGNSDGFLTRMTADLLAGAGGSAGSLQFSAATFSVTEGTPTVTITVSRTGGSTGAVAVNYATSNGTASGSDYTATSGTLNWANGDAASKSFSIAIADDTLVENAETINLTISSPVGAMLGAQATATVTIADNDTVPAQPGVLQLSSASYSANENGGSVVLTLTRTGGTDGAVGVSVNTGGGSATAGADYTALATTVSWTAGDAANKSVTLSLLDDAAVEGIETVLVALANPTGGASLGAVTAASVTITDDDVAPQPPPPPSKGGGAFELLWVLALGSFGLLRRR